MNGSELSVECDVPPKIKFYEFDHQKKSDLVPYQTSFQSGYVNMDNDLTTTNTG